MKTNGTEPMLLTPYMAISSLRLKFNQILRISTYVLGLSAIAACNQIDSSLDKVKVSITEAAKTKTGAEAGEFLGYKIGDRYPTSKLTKLYKSGEDWGYVLEAEQPIKPAEFGPVWLFVTKQTYTVLAITSSKDFPSQEQQLDFAKKYTAILSAQYPTAPRSSDETGTMFSFGPQDEHQKGFYLSVDLRRQTSDSPFNGNNPVHIELTYRSNHDLYDQALKESAEREREEAAKRGLNRGL